MTVRHREIYELRVRACTRSAAYSRFALLPMIS
jgi:hypothetical protein